MKKSLLYRFVVASIMGIVSIVPHLTSAADGLFGTYFERMVGTGPCVSGSVLVGFDGTPGSYGTRNCMSLLALLGSIYTTAAPAGQAMLGFNLDGSLRFGSVNWVRTGNNIAYTDGNVSVGAGTPVHTDKLFVSGNTRIQTGSLFLTQGNIRMSDGNIIVSSGYIQVDSNNNGDWGFVTQGVGGGIGLAGYAARINYPDLYVAGNGRVGVGGIVNPRTILDVSGEIVATNRLTLAQNTGSTSPTWHVDNSSDTFRIFRQPNISTPGTAFVHVTSLGNVGIGTPIALARMDIRGTLGNQTTLRVSAWDGASVATGWPSGWSGLQTWDILSRNTKVDRLQLGNKVILSAVGDAHANDNWIRMLSVSNPNEYSTYGLAAGRLFSAGEVWGREFIYTSDVRLKKNIETLKQAEDTIMSLRGVRFDWQDTEKQDIGFIAQEVESIAPELVNTNSDGYKAVKYGNVTAILVEALKSQMQKNQKQEVRIQELESRLNKIESIIR